MKIGFCAKNRQPVFPSFLCHRVKLLITGRHIFFLSVVKNRPSPHSHSCAWCQTGTGVGGLQTGDNFNFHFILQQSPKTSFQTVSYHQIKLNILIFQILSLALFTTQTGTVFHTH